jgi:hypothetical protein
MDADADGVRARVASLRPSRARAAPHPHAGALTALPSEGSSRRGGICGVRRRAASAASAAGAPLRGLRGRHGGGGQPDHGGRTGPGNEVGAEAGRRGGGERERGGALHARPLLAAHASRARGRGARLVMAWGAPRDGVGCASRVCLWGAPRDGGAA